MLLASILFPVSFDRGENQHKCKCGYELVNTLKKIHKFAIQIDGIVKIVENTIQTSNCWFLMNRLSKWFIESLKKKDSPTVYQINVMELQNESVIESFWWMDSKHESEWWILNPTRGLHLSMISLHKSGVTVSERLTVRGCVALKKK